MSPSARPAVVGAALLAAGWALGSVALALAGVGALAAGLAALAWSVVARRVRVDRSVEARTTVEGEPLGMTLRLHGATLLPGTFGLNDTVGPLTVATARLRRRGPMHVTIPMLPRGVHTIGPGRIVADDPLGLVRIEVVGPAGPTIRVRPRVVELVGTFADGGGAGPGGRRRAYLKHGGSEPHGVREYREGESLRGVHWISSARRGQLMVREMEEPPRDDVVIVLDLDESGVAGPPGASSLDEAVRAAAALVHAEVVRGRRARLVLAGVEPLRHTVSSSGADWEGALDALAGVGVAGGACTSSLLREAADSGLVLVTPRPLAAFADLLLRYGVVAVVSIDSPTYAGAQRTTADPALLRLAAHGVPIAVVRSGDDLRHALSRPLEAARA